MSFICEALVVTMIGSLFYFHIFSFLSLTRLTFRVITFMLNESAIFGHV